MIKFAIIISTYNWHQALDLCLNSLLPQLVEHSDVELIIADDGSNNYTKAIVNKYQELLNYKHISHIWHEDLGFRKSIILNKAIQATNADYLIFLDGDCFVLPDYIARHKQLAQKGYLVDGNRVLLSQGLTSKLINNCNYLIKILNWTSLDWLKAKIAKQTNVFLVKLKLDSNAWWRYLNNSNWRRPKGCNLAIWRHDFVAINGYDEKFIGWGHEDSDLIIRLLHYGIKIKNGRFSIPVIHLWHKQSDRGMVKANKALLLSRVADPKIIKAEVGYNQY